MKGSDPVKITSIIYESSAVSIVCVISIGSAFGTPDMRNGTWIYWKSSEDIIRLVFRRDRVTTILNVGQNL